VDLPTAMSRYPPTPPTRPGLPGLVVLDHALLLYYYLLQYIKLPSRYEHEFINATISFARSRVRLMHACRVSNAIVCPPYFSTLQSAFELVCTTIVTPALSSVCSAAVGSANNLLPSMYACVGVLVCECVESQWAVVSRWSRAQQQLSEATE
jgi:hypothetical protein